MLIHGLCITPLIDRVFEQCSPVLLWRIPLGWWCFIFMKHVNNLLVLAAKSIIVLSPFPQIRHSLNYLVCQRALIHINQESSCGTSCHIFNFHRSFKTNGCVAGHYVLPFLIWFINTGVLKGLVLFLTVALTLFYASWFETSGKVWDQCPLNCS